MISSRKIIFIFILPAFLDSMMPVYGVTKCEKNVLTTFEYEEYPDHLRRHVPRRAFLRLTINNISNDDAMRYFIHLYDLVSYKESLQLPRTFCEARTKSLKLQGGDEYENCVYLLFSTFKYPDNKTDIIKYTFWNFTEGMISEYNHNDYRYKYFYYLSGKIIYPQTAEQKFPLTIREFCATLYPDKYTSLMSRQELEFTKEEAITYCANTLYNDFEITVRWKQSKPRTYLPKAAFFTFVEEDLESSDAKDYYYHLYSVINAKDGTANPRKYCNIITEDDQEEKICVGILLSMYLDSDVTAVIKDAFQNFKESHFVKINKLDYRYRYYYYLSGFYEFDKIEHFKHTPLTPAEFCQMDRTDALNLRIITRSQSISEVGTSSSTSQEP